MTENINTQFTEHIRESDDYLFHFTDKYSSIISIMKEKFKPFFCVEDLSFIYEGEENLTMAFPMVCFCDIPIERHDRHIDKYGSYGIGLTKEWAQNNNLNIVNYSYKKSIVSASLRIMIRVYQDYLSEQHEYDIQGFKNALNILLMTSKPYEGRKFNKTKRDWSNYTFRYYDEKEWRYLPLVDKLNWSFSLEDYSNNYDIFFDEISKEQIKIQEKYKLDFSVNDIKYIFLISETEKEKFILDISNSYSKDELNHIEKLICITNKTLR